ncbi:MAG: undecaprenyl-diphosphatase UppP [Sphaerobacteraceae bacterium]|nr:MAG: undecaprenyl-diphosphatase UppP [Sphaerobacteraceae bacterium]
METIESIILGIVQGITEFLPVSSSAHIIVVPWLFGWSEPGLTFNVAVHMGTLLAVLLFFRSDIFAMALALPKGIAAGKPLADPMSRMAIIIIIGSIPAGIIGLTLGDRIEGAFHTAENGRLALVVIAIMLIFVGLLMLIVERKLPQHREFERIGWRDGIMIGMAQAVALIPGTSRSGATITAGMILGLKKDVAARFSFLLGIPIVAAAGLLEGIRLVERGLPADERAPFVVGALVSLVVGYFSIAFLLKFLQTNSVLVFTIYRCGLGVLLLVLVAGGWL